MKTSRARFRFYAELNDFLPRPRRQTAFDYDFFGTPAIKDAIEALGVPHPEVDLIVVDGASVGWEHRLADGEDVAVYPVFEALDISPIVRLRPEPLRVPRFIVDGNLGRLARWLRLLGFDTRHESGVGGKELLECALREQRILLTRDRALLKHAEVTHASWIRATHPRLQIGEVVDRLDLVSQFEPFSRCLVCNGRIVERDRAELLDRLPQRIRTRASAFFECSLCHKVFWEGSHVTRMRRLIDELARRAC